MNSLSVPIQLASTGINPPAQRSDSAQANDCAQFSQTLSRQMAQQQNCPAPVPASSPAPARPGTAQTVPAPQSPAREQDQAKPTDVKPAKASADASADAVKDDAAKAGDAAASTPVAELLALVASFNPPAVALATPASIALAAASKGRESTLAGADKVAGLTDAAPEIDGAAGFSLKALKGDAAAKGVLPATSKSAAVDAESVAALSGASHQPGLDDAAGAHQAVAPAPASPMPLSARDSAADVAVLKELLTAAPVTAPAQQASLAMAPALAAAPPERIAARVGTPAWDNQVGQKIIWMVAGKEQSASMTLNPPDMGPMQVVLSVTGEHASVTFSAAQPEVRQALENALPKLREMLGESGISLGNASVNAGLPDQRQAQQGEPPRQQGLNARFGGASETAPTMPAVPRTVRPDSGAGLVDTFA